MFNVSWAKSNKEVLEELHPVAVHIELPHLVESSDVNAALDKRNVEKTNDFTEYITDIPVDLTVEMNKGEVSFHMYATDQYFPFTVSIINLYDMIIMASLACIYLQD